ncbi:uncharacterized protein LOC124171936 [Ischnura elegans]|uniref:uncharacterized protein LOC124171936 n=1 Tax=Ischnura elegans TaxID=197161 RepID=UPI001ED87D98|nr:uncharacterized protein LOC124171936 [Ischnura elegans]
MKFGLTLMLIRRLAVEISEINGITVPSVWKERKMAVGWSEACTLSRATAFNRTITAEFHKNIEECLLRVPTFADGTRIYMLEEASTTTVQKPRKVIAQKGYRQVSQVTSAEIGILVTTCCIVSASGTFIPPVMAFPRARLQPSLLTGSPPGTIALKSTSGWMSSDIFPEVMAHSSSIPIAQKKTRLF